MRIGSSFVTRLHRVLVLVVCFLLIVPPMPTGARPARATPAVTSAHPQPSSVVAAPLPRPPAAATLPLTPGWNLLSLPEALSDSAPGTVLTSLAGSYSEVRAYDGCDAAKPERIYDPQNPARSDLTAIDHKMGLWVRMTTTDTLTISGTQVVSVTIPLCRGWNLIGYPFAATRPVAQALTSIQDKYLRVFTFDPTDAPDPWAVFDPAAPGYVNDATAMEPGRGYWLFATEDVTLYMTDQPGSPPEVTITQPFEGITVTAPISITGVISSPAPVTWELYYRLVDETNWTRFTSGAGAAAAATFDPTLLINGIYQIGLFARDIWGQTNSTVIHVSVMGEQKVGHVRLAFSDMAIDAVGIPLEVVRVYDSRDSRLGDFGVGWRLDVHQGSLQHNRTPGLGWQIQKASGPLGLPCQRVQELIPHYTEVRLSDLEYYRFRFRLVNPVIGLGGCYVTAIFEYSDGSYPGATLDIGSPQLFQPSGSDYVLDLGDTEPYVPRSATLRTIDGRQLDLTLGVGITRIQDPNDHVLSISDSGITHSSGLGVTFTRDAANRITQITDMLGYTTRYTYDASGNLSTFVDQEGGVTRYLYATALPHHLIAIIMPDGRQVAALDYDPDGRLTRTCNADNECARIEYDLDGRTQTHIDATGRRLIYTYDNFGNVLSVTDGLGNTTTYEYNAQGKLTREIDAVGGVTSYTYDAQGNLLSTITPHASDQPDADFTTTYAYNAQGQVTKVTMPTGAGYTHTYDARGNELQFTDEAGNLLSASTYDNQGHVLTEEDPFGTDTHSYDAKGNDIAGRDQYGQTTSATFDAANRLQTLTAEDGTVSTFHHDGFGRPTDVDYGNGITVTYEYARGAAWTTFASTNGGALQRKVATDGRLEGWVMPNGATTTYTHDAAGRLVGETESNGYGVSYTYDAAGQVSQVTTSLSNTTTYGRDPLGRVLTETNGLGQTSTYSYYVDGRLATYTDARNHTWRYQYALTSTITTDPLNRATVTIFSPHGLLEETIYPDGASSKTSYLLTTPILDGDEYPTAFTDPGGHTRRFAYSDVGDLIAASDLAGITSTYAYSNGLLITMSAPTGPTYAFAYDDLDRTTQIRYPDNGARIMRYNQGMVPVTVTLASGATINYTYNVDDQPLTRRTSSGENDSYQYTLNGAIAQTTDATGSTQYRYDLAGNLERITDPHGGFVNYGRDLLGRVITVTVQATTTVPAYVTLYAYDAADNVIAVTDPTGGRTTFTYDAANRLTERTLPNGVRTTYSYNDRDQLLAVVHRGQNGTVIAASTYERQGVGEPTKITREDGSYVRLTYDGALRLTGEAYYDAANALLETIAYTYDADGKRLSRTTAASRENYHYANGYQLTGITDAGGAALANYSYDADGRLRAIAEGGATRQLTFDDLDRLQGITDGSGVLLASYAYDARDQRTAASGPTGNRRWLLAPTSGSGLPSPQLLTDATGQAIAGYVYLRDQPLMRFGSTGPVYYLTDPIGSVIGLADNGGNRIAQFHYDGFGNLRQANGAGQAPPATAGGDFRFRSAWLESATNFYHLRARDYDPQTGRFLSRDPILPNPREPESLHPYAYAYNNPYLYHDPTGKFTIASVAISMDTQSALMMARVNMLNWVRKSVLEETTNFVVSQMVKNVVGTIVPGFPHDSTNPNSGKHGTNFESKIVKVICDQIRGNKQWTDALWLQVPIGDNGKPGGNGFNCGGSGKLSNKMANPDFVVSLVEPSKLKDPAFPEHIRSRSMLVGDFKVKIKNINTSSRQFGAIIEHAKEYGRHVALYISAGGSPRQAQFRIKQAAARKVALILIFPK